MIYYRDIERKQGNICYLSLLSTIINAYGVPTSEEELLFMGKGWQIRYFYTNDVRVYSLHKSFDNIMDIEAGIFCNEDDLFRLLESRLKIKIDILKITDIEIALEILYGELREYRIPMIMVGAYDLPYLKNSLQTKTNHFICLNGVDLCKRAFYVYDALVLDNPKTTFSGLLSVETVLKAIQNSVLMNKYCEIWIIKRCAEDYILLDKDMHISLLHANSQRLRMDYIESSEGKAYAELKALDQFIFDVEHKLIRRENELLTNIFTSIMHMNGIVPTYNLIKRYILNHCLKYGSSVLSVEETIEYFDKEIFYWKTLSNMFLMLNFTVDVNRQQSIYSKIVNMLRKIRCLHETTINKICLL